MARSTALTALEARQTKAVLSPSEGHERTALKVASPRAMAAMVIVGGRADSKPEVQKAISARVRMAESMAWQPSGPVVPFLCLRQLRLAVP
jgi:hypothetical protein